MSFGERLRTARKSKGYTQEQLAEIIGVAKSTLTGYERGNREPNVLKIHALAKALDVDANFLLTPPPTPDNEKPAIGDTDSGLTPNKQALIQAAGEMDDETARAVLEIVRQVKRLRGQG